MSYLDFYRLQKAPFNVTPDPEFLFLSPSHKEALGAFLYGIKNRKGIMVIVGEVGVGKTTVLRSYLERIDYRALKPIYLLNSNLRFPDLARTLCENLGVHVDGAEVYEMVNRIHMALIEHYNQGRNVVLIIDEAQNMPIETLENLRMLSNLETSSHKLLQIVLVGQPELTKLLDLHELRQLKQRIAVRATIRPLTPQESADYLRHRLKKCGARVDKIFNRAAFRSIIEEAHGYPRMLNILSDNALITGLGYQARPVTKKIVREITKDFRDREPESGIIRKFGFAVALLLLSIWIWSLVAERNKAKSSTTLPQNSQELVAKADRKSSGADPAESNSRKQEVIKDQPEARENRNPISSETSDRSAIQESKTTKSDVTKQSRVLSAIAIAPPPKSSDEELEKEDLEMEIASGFTPSPWPDTDSNHAAKVFSEEPMESTSQIVPPEPLLIEKPAYPYAARQMGIEGTVIVRILVNVEGHVDGVRILKSPAGNYGLDVAAAKTVSKWKFRPAVRNGQRVPVWVTYPVVFKIR